MYGKLALMNTYPSDPNGNVYLFSSWNNLMGDPLTHLWTNTPKNLIVNHGSIISSSSNYFDVMVSDEEGRPVNDATVTLYKNDEHSITSKTDEFGRAYFNLDFVDIGNVIVTSRCLNCVPEESSFVSSSASVDFALFPSFIENEEIHLSMKKWKLLLVL